MARPELAKPKILVVDDQEANLLSMTVALQELDCEAVERKSGASALEYLKENEVALVLLDIMMPVMDGFQAAVEMRKLPTFGSTPILFLSAIHPDSDQIQRAYEVGGADFLSKPVDIRILLSKISVFLELYEKRKVVEEQRNLVASSSEKERALLLENSLDAVIGANEKGEVIYWNKHAEVLFGWSSAEVLGKDMATLIVPEPQREAHNRGMRRFIETGISKIQGRRIEVPALTRGGSEIPVELTVTSIKSSGGLKLYSFIRDLSYRKKADEVQRKYQDLVESINHAIIWSAEPSLSSFSFVSPRTKVITGFSLEEWNAPGFFLSRIPSVDRANVTNLAKAAVNGEDLGIEHRFTHKDGTILWFHTGMRRAKRGDGSGWEIRGLSTDVTEIMEAKAAAKSSEEIFRNLSDSMPQMVFMADADGKSTHYNRRWYEYTGIAHGDLSAESWLHTIHPEDADSLAQSWATARSTGISWVHEYRVRRKDGVFRWHLGRSLPQRNSQGVITSWIGTVTDIEDQKRAQERIIELGQKEFQWMEMILNKVEAGVILVNPKNGEVLFTNEAANKMTGGLKKHVVDYSSSYRFMKEDGTVLPKELWPRARASRGETITREHFIWETPDGTWEYIVYAGLIPPMFGREATAFICLLDITELKETERALKLREEELRTLSNSIPQLTWMANPDGNIIWYNERWYHYTGMKPDDLIGWGWSQVHDPQILPEVVSKWKHSIQTGEHFEMAFPLRSAEGKFRWFLTRVIPVRDRSGNIIRWFGTNTDIQEQREIANDLKLKSNALENSLNGFDIVSEDGKIIYANKSYLRMWRFDSLDEIVGMSPASHCEDPNIPTKIVNTLKQSGQCDIEFVAKRKDGTTFDVRMLAFVAHDYTGREIYPTTSIDITEQKRAAKALLEAKDEAERANQLKSAFVANMSHEIRTPLGAMMGFAELLRDTELSSQERVDYTNILVRNGEQLALLINDILDISKVEAGHLTLEFSNMQPERVAASVVSLMGVKAKEKNLTLKYECLDSTPREVTSDPVRVRQVLLNLIGNAIKFTDSGTILLRSCGEKDAAGKTVTRFDVTDTGIGIAPDQQERIFDMFVQADGSMTRKFGGTGIGLSLARRFALSLGGDVRILSTSSSGSTFSFTFLDEPERSNLHLPAAPEIQVEPDSKVDTLSGVNVLVADDSEDNRVMIGMFLTRKGATVEHAEDGNEAYQKAMDGNFDVVLMDIQMPGMDGYTATQKLRRNGYVTPIIAITAHAMSDVREKCVRAGCSDHLPKPIKPGDLISTIARHLAHN